MSNIPSECRYSKTHEWALVESDNNISVGITEHAQHLLGDMVFVELPEVGVDVKAGDEIGVVESVKAASDFYAPVSGTIVEINENLEEAPGMVNNDPYGDGWLVKIAPSDEEELNDLLDSEAYADEIAEEV